MDAKQKNPSNTDELPLLCQHQCAGWCFLCHSSARLMLSTCLKAWFPHATRVQPNFEFGRLIEGD